MPENATTRDVIKQAVAKAGSTAGSEHEYVLLEEVRRAQKYSEVHISPREVSCNSRRRPDEARMRDSRNLLERHFYY